MRNAHDWRRRAGALSARGVVLAIVAAALVSFLRAESQRQPARSVPGGGRAQSAQSLPVEGVRR